MEIKRVAPETTDVLSHVSSSDRPVARTPVRIKKEKKSREHDEVYGQRLSREVSRVRFPDLWFDSCRCGLKPLTTNLPQGAPPRPNRNGMTDKTLKNCIWRYRQRSKAAVGSENRRDARSDIFGYAWPGGVSRADRRREMKLELIFINEKDGMVTMRKEELEDLVEKAYQAGRSDSGGGITNPWIVNPTPYYGKAVDATCNTGDKG